MLALPLALSGCVSIVEVQADQGRPRLSIWPAGVRVERGSADAISVRSLQFGADLNTGCGVVATIGVAAERCVVIDPRASLAIIDAGGKPVPKAVITDLSNALTKEK